MTGLLSIAVVWMVLINDAVLNPTPHQTQRDCKQWAALLEATGGAETEGYVYRCIMSPIPTEAQMRALYKFYKEENP